MKSFCLPVDFPGHGEAVAVSTPPAIHSSMGLRRQAAPGGPARPRGDALFAAGLAGLARDCRPGCGWADSSLAAKPAIRMGGCRAALRQPAPACAPSHLEKGNNKKKPGKESAE